MQAFILAGGLGTRLRGVVDDRPKALAPAGAAPFLDYQIDFLKERGVTELVFCVGHRSEQIRERYGNGARYGVSVEYSVETSPLGTGGALRNAVPFVRAPFLLVNGDTYFDLDLEALVEAHRGNRRATPWCAATLALTQTDDPARYGSVVLDRSRRIVEYLEKSPPDDGGPCWVSGGISVVEPSLLELIPPGRKVSLEHETLPRALREGRPLYGHPAEGFFVDIGTPEGLDHFRAHLEGIPS